MAHLEASSFLLNFAWLALTLQIFLEISELDFCRVQTLSPQIYKQINKFDSERVRS